MSSAIVGGGVVLEYCKYTVLSPPVGKNVFRRDLTIHLRDSKSILCTNDESIIIPATEFAMPSIPAGVKTCSSDNRKSIRSGAISVKSSSWVLETTTLAAPASRN